MSHCGGGEGGRRTMIVGKMGRAVMRESNTCVVNLVMEAVMLVVVAVGAGDGESEGG